MKVMPKENPITNVMFFLYNNLLMFVNICVCYDCIERLLFEFVTPSIL